MDRSETMRAVAKMLAYLAVGKRAEAQEWADRLTAGMRAAGLVIR